MKLKLLNLKKIKKKININQINDDQNWTQLIFGRAGVKSKVRKEKRGRKKKSIIAQPLVCRTHVHGH